MTYSTVLITHVVNDAVIEGFIPALLKSRHVPDSQLIIITDDKEAHMDALIATPLGAQISILECDVFNPLAIIDTLNNYHILPDLVFSNSDHLLGPLLGQALPAHYHQYYVAHGICPTLSQIAQ